MRVSFMEADCVTAKAESTKAKYDIAEAYPDTNRDCSVFMGGDWKLAARLTVIRMLAA